MRSLGGILLRIVRWTSGIFSVLGWLLTWTLYREVLQDLLGWFFGFIVALVMPFGVLVVPFLESDVITPERMVTYWFLLAVSVLSSFVWYLSWWRHVDRAFND